MSESSPKTIRVMIIDDHAVVRAGLRMLIENHPTMHVVAMASSGTEALDILARESADLILLDLDLGKENGLTFVQELRAASNSARILILTGLRDPAAHRQAVKLGAMGVVVKDQAAEVLIKAIEKVNAGEIWLDRATMGNVLNEMTGQGQGELDSADTRINSLTDREREVIALIAEGLKNKQIGKRLFISETTVTHHLSSIFSKLGVSDRLELVIYAFGHNLVRIPNPRK
jgi:two-component system, NarL family, nitrate/nitrite response regulator NarL